MIDLLGRRPSLLDVEGRPTARAVQLYTESDCWLLSYYFMSLGGLPIVLLGPADDPEDWHHVMVDLGRETLLDVRGPASRDETLAWWEEKLSHRYEGPWALKDIGRFTTMTDYVTKIEALAGDWIAEQDETNARAVAAALLARHAPPRKDGA